MRNRAIVVLVLNMLSVPAGAETIVFEADSEILVVRGFETAMGWVQFDILVSRDGTVLCVAIGKDGTPVATSSGFSNVGFVAFMEIALKDIDKVVCRYD